MLGRNNGQIDLFTSMIYEKLIPKDHLLIKIDSIIDFSFVYEKVKDRYSEIGRGSKDPAMMLKMCLLEYLYKLSDPQLESRVKTDVAFRWFLGLNLDDSVPDETTISYFRVKRLGEESFEEFFNEIVRKCIEYDLVKTKRYIIDTTDVAANVNYPSDKKLICDAYRKVIKEVMKFNEALAKEQLERFESDIDKEYENCEKVSKLRYLKIAIERMEYLYLKTYDEICSNDRYKEVYAIAWDIIEQYTDNSKDKIVSVVDPDARVAHKSPGNIKRGYKSHIIVDEESEIIVSSVQTPFNVGDEKKLEELVGKTERDFHLKPEEITADKVYGTINNRAFLKDRKIISNIRFYEESVKKSEYYTLKDFVIPEDLKSVTCPNGVTTEDYIKAYDKTKKRDMKIFTFDSSICKNCPLSKQCISKSTSSKGRRVEMYDRYDAVITDKKRIDTPEFEVAQNKRFKVERRFATMVANHGLRRCRYIRLSGAKIHIILSNMACNIVRMVNLLCQPNFRVPQKLGII